MSFLNNIKNGSCWNIGFCEYTPEMLIKNRALPTIQWMKHPYKDRFFADPFILKVTDMEIVVLAEEYVFDNAKIQDTLRHRHRGKPALHGQHHH